MKLHQRDLRRQPIPYSDHLPPSCRLVVKGIWMLFATGFVGAALLGVQQWQAKKQLGNLKEEEKAAGKQQMLLHQADQRLVKNAEMAHEIQSWLLGRSDAEALYHEIADFIGEDILIEKLSVENVAAESVIRVNCQVEGDADEYTPFFRAITDFLTTRKAMVIADIQMALNQTGGTLSLDLQMPKSSPSPSINLNDRTVKTNEQ